VSLTINSVAHAASTRDAQSPLICEAKLEPRGREASLASPNQRALVSSTKFTPLSEVKGISPSTDSFAYAASALRDASKVPNYKARI